MTHTSDVNLSLLLPWSRYLTETIKFHGDELDADELAFFKAQTKIQDDDELKSHITAVQAKAYKFYPYPCIKRLGYVVTTSKLCDHDE
jgi:hypothetical protein